MLESTSSTYTFSVCVCICSDVSNSATPWTVAHQSPLSIEFSRQVYWSVLPFPIPGDLPDPGIKPASLCKDLINADQLNFLRQP